MWYNDINTLKYCSDALPLLNTASDFHLEPVSTVPYRYKTCGFKRY